MALCALDDLDIEFSLIITSHPFKFGGHKFRGIKDIMLNICHVT